MICITCGTQFQPPAKCPACGWNVKDFRQPDTICQVGEIVGARYTIQQSLGVGRFGVCFKARDSRLNSVVALKFIHPAYLPDGRHRHKFVEDMSFMLQNNYPLITRVFDVGMMEGYAYVSSEFVDGVPLWNLFQNRIQDGRCFSLNEVFPLLRQVAAVLLESDCGPHGALSPRNIFILSGSLRVLDSGIMASLPEEALGYLMSEMSRSRRYVAPEIISSGHVSRRSDVYSLGAMMGEMLTLRRFNGSAAMFSQVDPDMPQEVAALLMEALAEDRRYRFRDVEAFINAFCRVAGLPEPRFKRPWDRIPEDSIMEESLDASVIQAETTARIVMADVIQQHYEEVTAIGANPLLSRDGSSPYIPVPKPRAPGAGPLVSQRADAPTRVRTEEATMILDMDAIEDSGVSTIGDVTQTISIDDIQVDAGEGQRDPGTDIDPRLLRAAAAKSPSRTVSETEDRGTSSPQMPSGIDPRFLRAAAAPSHVTPPSEKNVPSDSDDDWRTRIAQESATENVVSFVAEPSWEGDSNVSGFPARRPLREREHIPAPPVPRPKKHT